MTQKDPIVEEVKEILEMAKSRLDENKMPASFINFDYEQETKEELADAVNYLLFRGVQIILQLREKKNAKTS